MVLELALHPIPESQAVVFVFKSRFELNDVRWVLDLLGFPGNVRDIEPTLAELFIFLGLN
ncbi:hypothetical protein D3C75_1243420 [compost metagenome]